MLSRRQLVSVGIVIVGIMVVIGTVGPVSIIDTGNLEPPQRDDAGSAAQLDAAPQSSANATSTNSTGLVLNESDLPSEPVDRSKQTASNTPTTVIVEATNGSSIDVNALESMGAEVGSRDGRYLEVTASPETVQQIHELPWVREIRPEASPVPAELSEGVSSMYAQRLQELGVTGDGVKVGIITLGVRPDSPEYSDQVVATKSFHPGGLRAYDSTHGTAVAEVVADTAPGSSLYLTSFDSPVDFRKSASWLVSQNVDIIVMSIGWPTEPDDGTGMISEVVTNATKEEVLWANAAGNAAEKHWQGDFTDYDDDHWLNIDGEVEANALADGRYLSDGTKIELYLNWNDFPYSDDDYTLYLFDSNNNVIDKSNREFEGSNKPVEILSTNLPYDDRYYYAIAGSDSTHTIEVIGSDSVRPFSYSVPEGSVTAPAVAKGVTGVGAYHVDTDELAPYSSAGPTTDGRRGVDVLGPSKVTTQAYDGAFRGTSAAAPHIGGAAALLLEINPSASPEEVERALMESAIDVGPYGYDVYTGAGKANVTAAAENIDPAVPLTITANRSQPVVGNPILYRVTRMDTGEPVNAKFAIEDDSWKTGPDGEIVIEYYSSGEYPITATALRDPPTADFQSAGMDESVEPRVVDLNLTANRTSLLDNGTVRFTVSSESNSYPVPNVTVSVDGEVYQTDDTGHVTHRFSETGRYSVTATRENTSTYHYIPDSVEVAVREPANLSVSEYRVQETTVAPGESVTVTATVSNAGEVPGVRNVTLYVDGESIRTKQVFVAGNGSGTASFTTTFNDEGTHTVAVGMLEPTIINVTEAVAGPPPLTGFGNPPKDMDGDGRFEDVNGDGSFNIIDVALFLQERNSEPVQNNQNAFDFNGDGTANIIDVSVLLSEL